MRFWRKGGEPGSGRSRLSMLLLVAVIVLACIVGFLVVFSLRSEPAEAHAGSGSLVVLALGVLILAAAVRHFEVGRRTPAPSTRW